MSKLLWPLQVVNLKIPGLFKFLAYFVQNNTTIILPDHTRRTTSEVPCRTPTVHFWRQINSLEAQNLSYFSLFTIWSGFWNCKSLFVHIQFHFQWEKRLDFSAFPDLLTWRQDTKIFPARWTLICQFKFPTRQPYARRGCSFQPSFMHSVYSTVIRWKKSVICQIIKHDN